MLATAVFPATMACGLIAVAVAQMTAAALSLSQESSRRGVYGYNAALVGLACGAAFGWGWATVAMVVAGSAVSVVLTGAMHSLLGVVSLPTLSLPFLVVILTLLGYAPMVGVSYSFADFHLGQAAWGLPEVMSDFLVSLGALVFAPSPLAGAIVLVGLLLYSRIAAGLAIFGYAVAVVVGVFVVELIPARAHLFLTITAIVVAMALGGVWFVPSPAAFGLVAAAAAFASVAAIANFTLLGHVGFPILFVPLNLTIWMFLLAMRQRERDGAPKAVDFLVGSPEENLSYYRTHVARFGAHYRMRFRAPFHGEWTCTQGPEGEITHKGYWRHALDFEVLGRDGEPFSGTGEELEDYHCYGLPVLAPAAGRVVHITDDVLDNAIGQTNTQQNWGNCVLIEHGVGVYSLLAHLKPGEARVQEGQFVRSGQEVARCGNTGRSPVPHLHFHLQATPVVGAPTRHTELHDVMTRDEGGHDRLVNTMVPARGDALRNLEPDRAIREAVQPAHRGYVLRHGDGEREEIAVDVDLASRRVMVSAWRARLYYAQSPGIFTVYDVIGARSSGLHLWRMALGRVPYELGPALRWTDFLPLKYVVPRWVGWLLDFAAPFMPGAGIEMHYRARSLEAGAWAIEGRSARTRNGAPWVETRAVLEPGEGPKTLEIRVAARRRVVEIEPMEA